jgi:hypothetical protein
MCGQFCQDNAEKPQFGTGCGFFLLFANILQKYGSFSLEKGLL